MTDRVENKMSQTDYVKHNEQLIGLLKEFPILGNSDNDEEFRSLLDQGEIRNYKPGEVILDSNSDENWVYYLMNGKVRVVKHGKEFMVLRRIGDYIGRKGMINGMFRAQTVTAVDATALLAFNLSKMESALEIDEIPLKYLLFRAIAETFAFHLRETSRELKEARLEIKQLKARLSE